MSKDQQDGRCKCGKLPELEEAQKVSQQGTYNPHWRVKCSCGAKGLDWRPSQGMAIQEWENKRQ